MPRDGSGNYTLPPIYVAIDGDPIEPVQHNQPLEDIAAALTASLPRNGTASMAGALNMGSQAITNAGIVGAAGLTIGPATFSSAPMMVKVVLGTAAAFDNSVAGGSGDCLSSNRATSDGNFYTLYKGGAQVGSISVSSGVTAYNTTSDERLKEDFENIVGAGEIIDTLEPLTFRFKAFPDAPRAYGFKAQAVHVSFPFAATPGYGEPEDNDFRPWQMDHTKLIPLLVAEIKSLRARVHALESA